MNQRKAKAIRRLARSLTVGVPWRRYTSSKRGQLLLLRGCGRSLQQRLKRRGAA